jgi:uncharacterized protein (TIGR03118 family)
MSFATRLARPDSPRRPDPLRFRPAVERLDDRCVPSGFRQTNLVADEPGVALLHDPSLVNGWGVSLSSAGGAFWVSAHGTGISELYLGDVNGSPFVKAGFSVAVPGGAPTGQVFNGTGQFLVQSGPASGTALFVFAGESGFVTGWNPAVPPPPPSQLAQVAVARPGAAAYTGLALGNNGTGNFLYAADFKNKRIDVFNSAFAPATLAGNFVDPHIPDRYAPFNIQNLGGKLYVTYARQDRDGGLSNGGNGFVSVFDLNGNFIRRLVSHGHLKSPWGLALAPAGFGEFGGALLVGNHGDGRIHAYNPNTGKFLGRLEDQRGRAVRIDGLFGLAFGNGVSAGDANTLYFAAGPDDGTDGLFGSLRFVPGGHGGHGRRGGSPGGGIHLPDGAVAGRVVVKTVKADPRAAAEAVFRAAPAPAGSQQEARSDGGVAVTTWIDPLSEATFGGVEL